VYGSAAAGGEVESSGRQAPPGEAEDALRRGRRGRIAPLDALVTAREALPVLLFRQAIDWITDRHRPTAEAAIRRVERVEARFGFDTGVRSVVVLSGPLEARYRPSDRWILPSTVRLPPLPPRSRRLTEFVYHEVGHAMVERHGLGDVLARFTPRVCDDDDYEAVTARAALAPRPRGFVSAYAAFCALSTMERVKRFELSTSTLARWRSPAPRRFQPWKSAVESARRRRRASTRFGPLV
jgi:hypothetical protein